MNTATLTIPAPDEIREQIRARVSEVRALRQMLKLAEAAQQAEEARKRQRPLVLKGGTSNAS